MEPLNNIKIELLRRGKKLKNLANDLPMDYGRLGRVINGFDRVPDGFNFRVNRVLGKWDQDKAGEGGRK